MTKLNPTSVTQSNRKAEQDLESVFLFSLSCVIFVLWEADSRFRLKIAKNYPGRAGKTKREK